MRKRVLPLALALAIGLTFLPTGAWAYTRKFNQNFAYRDSIRFEVPAKGHVELAVTSPLVEISKFWSEIVSSSGETVMGRKKLWEDGWMFATGRRVVIFTGDLPAGIYYFKMYYFGVGTGMTYAAGSDMEKDDYNRSKYNGKYYEIEWTFDCYHKSTKTNTVRKATCAETGREETVCDCGQLISASTIQKLPHTGEWKRVVEPTCDKVGTETLLCSVCGQTATRDVPKLGHTYGSWTRVTQPTCAQMGLETRVCSRCGEEDRRNVNTLAHSYGDWQRKTDPTCKTVGTEVRLCTECGREGYSRTVDKLQHKMVYTTTSTCTTKGRRIATCSLCGTSEVRDWDWPALGHSYGAWVATSAAACGQKGTEERVCTRCGYKDSRTVAALSHSYGAWVVTSAAACGQKGTEERECTRCGHKDSRTVAALSHSYSPWSVSIPAACGQNGTEVRTCTRCGEGENREIKALVHRFGSWTASVPATCAQEGTEIRTCSLCAGTETRSIPALKTHSYGSWEVTKRGNCTTKGEKQRLCTVCGYVEKSDTTLEDDHSFGDWTVSVAATCGKKGTEVNVCALCGKKGTRDIPALEHKYADWTVASPAVCEKKGTEVNVCTLCGRKETRDIPALEHSYGEWSVKTPATCVQEGSEVRTCSLCAGTETHPVPIVEHTYGQWKITRKGNCSAKGEKEQVCTVCGKADKQPTDLEDDHSFGEWELTEEPTCAEEGTEIRVCSLCAWEDSQSVGKLEHSYGDWRVTVPATCTKEGTQQRVCEKCKEKETKALPKLPHTNEEIALGLIGERQGYRTRCTVCGYEGKPYYKGENSGQEVSVTKADATTPTVIVLIVPAFSDVSASSWYQSVVTYAYSLGLMVGNSETIFNPTGNMTVAEAITMASRAKNSYEGGTNEDFKASKVWYQTYIDYAVEKGILKAGDFDNYERPATRAEMAYLFAHALPAEGMKAINTVEKLPDVTSGTKYSQEIFTLYRAGVLTGQDKQGTFAPDSPITRAEAAAIITRVTLSSERKTLTLP